VTDTQLEQPAAPTAAMKTLDVPATIPLSKVRAFLTDLGIPLEDTIELNIGTDGVYVEMWARNENGAHYIPAASKEPARHRIAIPLDVDA
jgi:hypothetical protein